MEYGKDSKSKKKNINIGIELLRMIFSFLIVVYHLHSKKKKSNTLKFSLYFLGFYTSTFFLISFYFSFRSLSSKNNIMIKERLKRIISIYNLAFNNFFWKKYFHLYKFSPFFIFNKRFIFTISCWKDNKRCFLVPI